MGPLVSTSSRLEAEVLAGDNSIDQHKVSRVSEVQRSEAAREEKRRREIKRRSEEESG